METRPLDWVRAMAVGEGIRRRRKGDGEACLGGGRRVWRICEGGPVVGESFFFSRTWFGFFALVFDLRGVKENGFFSLHI